MAIEICHFHLNSLLSRQSRRKNSLERFCFPLNLFFNLLYALLTMFARKANGSPTRSIKSGNSTTSSSRSTISPKTTLNSQTRKDVSVTKSRVPAVAAKKESTPQSSFDEVDDGPVPEGLVRCRICKRNFADDRIEKHQVICQKTKTKKRRVYDASKIRVQVSL